MISITCTQCRTVLTIDDAFAGGVCRCQHCGTIQTVPKGGAAAASSVHSSASTSKALYQNQSSRTTGGNVATTGATSPSGLDDLAQAVVSSGLSGSGLRSGGLTGGGASGGSVPSTPQAELASPARSTAKSPAKSPDGAVESKKKLPIIPIAIGGGVVVVGVIIWIVIRVIGGGGGGSTAGGGAGTAAPSNASFSDIKLAGSSVVYVIDRGNSIQNDFDEVKAATYASVRTLGADGKFAVILWNTDGADIAFPDSGMRNATSDQVTLMENQLDKVQATGASHLRGGLERALARNPSSIVIITGKDTRLAEDDENALASARETSAGKIKFYLIAVSKENPTFKLAAGPNLEYHMIPGKELH